MTGCRLVLRAEPKSGTTDKRYEQERKPIGSIVAVLEFGQNPGTAIMDDPRWRVVDIPDMSVSEASAHATPEMPDIDETLDVRKSAKLMDIATLEINHVARRNAVVTVSASEMRPLISTRPRVKKVDVIGDSTRVLG
jgi:homospermidine synthase